MDNQMGKDVNCRLGNVESVSDKMVKVKVVQFSACADCHAHSACSVSDSTGKIIEIPLTGRKPEVGQQIQITSEVSMGLIATVWAYIIPVVLIISSLVLSSFFSINQILSALISLLVLACYYFVLYLTRALFSKHFTLKIKL